MVHEILSVGDGLTAVKLTHTDEPSHVRTVTNVSIPPYHEVVNPVLLAGRVPAEEILVKPDPDLNISLMVAHRLQNQYRN